MNKYRQKQAELYEEGRQYQLHNLYHYLGINTEEDGEEYEEDYSYGEISELTAYLEEQGHRYGLISLFKNEGVI